MQRKLSNSIKSAFPSAMVSTLSISLLLRVLIMMKRKDLFTQLALLLSQIIALGLLYTAQGQ
jgi:hypothetical protein